MSHVSLFAIPVETKQASAAIFQVNFSPTPNYLEHGQSRIGKRSNHPSL